MCFRGPTNLKVVHGTLENMLKIKNTVKAFLSIQTDQDMKVKYYHKADFRVVEDLGMELLCGCWDTHESFKFPSHSTNTNYVPVFTGLMQKPESLVISELVHRGSDCLCDPHIPSWGPMCWERLLGEPGPRGVGWTRVNWCSVVFFFLELFLLSSISDQPLFWWTHCWFRWWFFHWRLLIWEAFCLVKLAFLPLPQCVTYQCYGSGRFLSSYFQEPHCRPAHHCHLVWRQCDVSPQRPVKVVPNPGRETSGGGLWASQTVCKGYVLGCFSGKKLSSFHQISRKVCEPNPGTGVTVGVTWFKGPHPPLPQPSPLQCEDQRSEHAWDAQNQTGRIVCVQ